MKFCACVYHLIAAKRVKELFDIGFYVVSYREDSCDVDGNYADLKVSISEKEWSQCFQYSQEIYRNGKTKKCYLATIKNLKIAIWKEEECEKESTSQ